ncbi:MAG: GNAT family N-acetyltransferase [Proteobacteria bacterium]|nr:GNAT family N-acetyltransferase [Pseudomonadota bacterium]
MTLPIIETQRLILRGIRVSDEPEFLELAGDWHVARMTSDIPHPLLASHAKAWLSPNGSDVRFAMEIDGRMIGSAGYFRRRSGTAELGFWLGRRYWGQGFTTEAAQAVVMHGFRVGGHKGFSSAHFVDNPASARVLAKLGFEPSQRVAMWCSARGLEVEAVTLQLSREKAETVLGPLGMAAVAEVRRPSLVARWFGQARQMLKDQLSA